MEKVFPCNLSRLIIILIAISSVLSHSPPVVAILANPQPDNTNDAQFSRVNYQYVRWVEAARAEVVVIQPWYSREQVDDILSKVNGVIWLGGDRTLVLGGQFETVAKYILEKVIQLYDEEGVSLPLWGTCQGFEMLHILLAGTHDVLTHFEAFNIQSPIKLNANVKSRMFSKFGEENLKNLQSMNTTAQFHHYGVEDYQYEVYPQLKEFFDITSHGYDVNGKEYISTMEGKKYPIYGVQFHPEMVPYTKDTETGVPQSIEAMAISQEFGNFFLKQVIQNKQQMTIEEMKKYDYLNSFTQLPRFEEDYYFYLFEKNHQTNNDTLKFLIE